MATRLTIVNKIKTLEASTGDDEIAHSLEDEIYRDFIDFAVDNGTGKLRELALKVQLIRHLDFQRYCS